MPGTSREVVARAAKTMGAPFAISIDRDEFTLIAQDRLARPLVLLDPTEVTFITAHALPRQLV
jgi:hypothetical protein